MDFRGSVGCDREKKEMMEMVSAPEGRRLKKTGREWGSKRL